MEEKILIKSERYNISKFLIVFVIIGIVLSVISYVTELEDAKTIYDSYYEHCQDLQCGWPYEYYEKCYACEGIRFLGDECLSESEYAAALVMREDIGIVILPALICAAISFIIYLWLRSYELTVTDKRIYGRVAWGKRVDLPNDSISATATITTWKGVSVSTASGRISFLVMKNAEEIYKTINELLIKRQSKPTATTTIKQEIQQSNADELKKYKELLDSGVISQEEFDAKKKQFFRWFGRQGKLCFCTG